MINTNFWAAVESLIASLSDSIGRKLDTPVSAYLAGGSAFHFYTQERTSRDADISFSHRIIIPTGMVEFYYDNEAHEERSVKIDNNYHNALGLMHPDYEKDAVEVGFFGKDKNIRLLVISPLDLAVSKLTRFSAADESDIKVLAGLRLFTKTELKDRAEEAMQYYVGDLSMTKYALGLICDYMGSLEKGRGSKP